MKMNIMKTTKSRRALFNLTVSLIIAIVFIIFSIAIRLPSRIYTFLEAYTHARIPDFIISLIFVVLALLLWRTYQLWRDAAEKSVELENIIDSISPDVFMVIDRDRKIQMCNSSVRRVFGYSVSEITGKKTDFLYHDRRLNPHHEHEIFDMLEFEGFHLGTAIGKKKNGTEIPLEIITGSLEGQSGAVLLIRDITERERAEEKKKEFATAVAGATEKVLHAMLNELERLAKVAINSEERIEELKKEVATLRNQLAE